MRRASSSATRGIIGTLRTRLPFGIFSTPPEAITPDTIDAYKEKLITEGRLSNSEVAPHVHEPGDEIDVAPAQPEEFPLPQAGVGGSIGWSPNSGSR